MVGGSRQCNISSDEIANPSTSLNTRTGPDIQQHASKYGNAHDFGGRYEAAHENAIKNDNFHHGSATINT
jgi:hypothetical protein